MRDGLRLQYLQVQAELPLLVLLLGTESKARTVNGDAYRWNPDMPPLGHKHAWTRVYRSNGREAHIAELIYPAHHESWDESWDYTDSWFGTGSQDEYDQAAQLPLCLKCFIIREQHEQG